MTNKKLKLAAMSVALTACVAAQPMAAHAVEGPDSVEDNAAPQAEPAPVEGKTAEGEVEGEEEKQEEFVPPVNDEAKKDDQAPAFGPGTNTDDIIIDYKPAEKPDESGKSGEDGEADGSEGSGETDETENPDGTYVKGDVIDNSKKDEATGKDGKIGEATKEETPDSSFSTTVVDPDAEVKKGDPVVGKDEDGNTTITTPTETTGTQTTTTTGTGKADSTTDIKETEETAKGDKIDLDTELGKDRDKLTWGTESGDTLGGYTVYKVEGKDENSKELTLTKTDDTAPEKEMSAEDIAKLLDVTGPGAELNKETDADGNTTYTLTKTETFEDEKGNTVTRVTYYQITDNRVKTTTSTTLVIKMEKGTETVKDKDLTTEVKLPSIKDSNDKEILSAEELGDLLKDQTAIDGVYTVKREKNGKTYIYKITEAKSSDTLTSEQLYDRLKDEGYKYENGKLYYNGIELNDVQINAVRKTLSYTVEVTEETKNPGQVSGKDEAETTAKTEAIKEALRNAAKQNGIELTEDELKNIKLTGGDLIVTRKDKTYTFHYTKAGVEYSAPIDTDDTTVDGKEAEDVKETTVTGTAYVTNGTISWSKPGESGTYTASGTLKPGDNHIASKPAKPTGDNVTFTQEGDAAVYTVTTQNPDGSTTETIYTFREAVVSLSSPEAKQAAWEALAASTGKSIEDLKAEGYTITGIDFGSITKSTWTVETRTRKTEKTNESLNQKILKAEGDPTWTLKDNTLTVNGKDIYENLKKNADGTYTATKEDGDKTITYTFTLGEDKSLDEPTIKAMLTKEFPESNGQITLDTTANTATYRKADGSTVTIDYSNLSKKTLKIDKSVSEAVSVTETIKTDADLKAAQDKLYEELKKKVESIKLKDGEELWIGDLKIENIKDQREEIIEHFTTAVSHENMSKEALIAALNAQAEEAKTTKVTVNKGTDYEETLNNYYSGDKKFEHSPKDPPWYREPGKGDNITHLDLASGAKMDKLADADGKVTQTDCVLLAKNQKLEWNYDAGKLLADQSTLKKTDQNRTVGLQDYISKDKEDGKGYHYEYNRSGNNNNPNKSAFYKLTGTVAYDALKNADGTITEYSSQREAINDYLKDAGRTNESYDTLTKKQREEILGTYVVPITTGRKTIYQVYTKTAEMTSYGYMTRDANTCVNATFGRQYEDSWFTDDWDYVGGYDLMISNLVQVSEGKVVGQTQSSIKTLWAPLAIRSTQSLENKSLQLDAKHTSTPKTETENLGSGYEEKGTFTYDVSYNHTDDYASTESKGVKGTGTDKYKTFTLLVKKMFSGKGETSYDTGSVSYNYRTTDKVDTTPVSKETVTTTDAHVGYNYTSIETRTVTVNGEETVIVPPVTPPVDPDTPDGPVEDETPDEVVTPETPELPAVQDAAPDDAAPETPVLPSDAVLPAVQDATALPQTGVNWMAALGMAFSGMLLTIAGAFTSLKYKEKH